MGALAGPLVLSLGGSPTIQGVPASAARDAFGVDVFFDGQLRVTPASDYEEVEGIENLRRAILRRLSVRPKEFKWRPEYGVGVADFVKKPQSRATLDELRRRVIDQLSLERRIAKVLEVPIERLVIGTEPALAVGAHVQALGRTILFQPHTFFLEK